MSSVLRHVMCSNSYILSIDDLYHVVLIALHLEIINLQPETFDVENIML